MVVPPLKELSGKLVVSLKIKPVAPEVTPVTWTPPDEKLAVTVGLGKPLIVNFTKLRTSNAYNLYTLSAFVLEEPAPTLPSCSCWNALHRKTPTAFPPVTVPPLVSFSLSHNNIGLYGVVSSEMSPISGVPYTLVSLR